MTTKLPKRDVVVVGLGGAGGVAVVPLTEAGLDVVGLEAGTWLQPRDFARKPCQRRFDLRHVRLVGEDILPAHELAEQSDRRTCAFDVNA